MDLKEFVSQTLCQIVDGVKQAQESVSPHGANVNPWLNSSPAEAGKHGFLWGGNGYVQIVRFDVALTVIEGVGTKGGIGVFAGAVSLGTSGRTKNESSSVSRVEFAVPLALPKPIIDEPKPNTS